MTYVVNYHLSKYAGDHQRYETAGDLETANNNLTTTANKASESYASNMLKGNLSTYQTLTLNHNSTASDTLLHFQGPPLTLRVTIDDMLNFNNHIKEICRKASQSKSV